MSIVIATLAFTALLLSMWVLGMSMLTLIEAHLA